jgi:hypothetical protein
MLDIRDEETMRPSIDTFNPDAGTANAVDARVWRCAVVLVCAVNLDLSRATTSGDQAICPCSVLVDVTIQHQYRGSKSGDYRHT